MKLTDNKHKVSSPCELRLVLIMYSFFSFPFLAVKKHTKKTIPPEKNGPLTLNVMEGGGVGGGSFPAVICIPGKSLFNDFPVKLVLVSNVVVPISVATLSTQIPPVKTGKVRTLRCCARLSALKPSALSFSPGERL